MYRSILSVQLALCLLATALPAEESIQVSLQTVGGQVREYNPNLISARFLIEEAKGRHHQAGRLDNPSFNMGYSQDSSFGERDMEVGFSQKFPLTSRLKIEKSMTESEWKQAEEEVRQVERELVMAAHSAIVRIIALRQRRQLLEKQASILFEFADFLNKVADKGEGSRLDARQARVETDIFMLEVKQLRAAEAAEIGILKPLLGVDSRQTVIIVGSLESPLAYDKPVDLIQRADYQAALHRLEAAREGVDLAKAHKYEDIEVGVFAEWSREKETPGHYENKTIMGVQLTVPLPLWNRNQGSIMEARARLRRREHELSALIRSIRLEADTAKEEMSQWADLYREIEEDLSPLAAEQASLVEEAYLQGMSELSSVFRAKEKQVQLDLAKLDSLREYHLARIRYEASVNSL